MPIIGQCPNAACGQQLQVPDEYVGQQAPCPTCGTMVLFAAPTPPTPAPAANGPALPAPSMPPAYAPPPPAGPGAYTMQPPAGVSSPPPGPPAAFSASTLELVQTFVLPAGLFFLALTVVSIFLPWDAAFSGIGSRSAIVLLFTCLGVGGLAASSYRFKELLPLDAVIAAGFGTFLFFVMLAELTARGGGARGGLWLGVVMALFVAGAFTTLAVFRPLTWRLLRQNLPPLVKQHGALLFAHALGFGLGVFYLVVTAASGPVLG
jgi:hypothetical protein